MGIEKVRYTKFTCNICDRNINKTHTTGGSYAIMVKANRIVVWNKNHKKRNDVIIICEECTEVIRKKVLEKNETMQV